MKKLLLILLLSAGAGSLLADYCDTVCQDSPEGVFRCSQACGACNASCNYYSMRQEQDKYASCMDSCMND